ncbi:hypothetical protein [Gaoshiqia sediminis]|jgi:hypothetical protein|uniref:Uncharacterized protein n=1 Tax=Gaoshiqia sediminis TaxID=2986998 RepID=A0AA41YB72_9BACT|nr:hypothetical protein [Gaoshiqia sediminis]MCW0484837.1 hypothetical protein [Gaoshiqia sediminis]|tara:strand:+ start:6751 stop:6954 length:204 start_codon:yes stop_codon:yes gene_type:complete
MKEFILFFPTRRYLEGQYTDVTATTQTAHLQIAHADPRPKFAKELFPSLRTGRFFRSIGNCIFDTNL